MLGRNLKSIRQKVSPKSCRTAGCPTPPSTMLLGNKKQTCHWCDKTCFLSHYSLFFCSHTNAVFEWVDTGSRALTRRSIQCVRCSKYFQSLDCTRGMVLEVSLTPTQHAKKIKSLLTSHWTAPLWAILW